MHPRETEAFIEVLEARITPSSLNFNGGILSGQSERVDHFIRGDSGMTIGEFEGPSVVFIGTLLPFGEPEIVSPSELHYKDADGDGITVKFNRDVLTEESMAEAFRFEQGERGYSLVELDVSKLGKSEKYLKGLDITIMATAAMYLKPLWQEELSYHLVFEGGITHFSTLDLEAMPTSNGKADIGFLDAGGIDLGNVFVDGNLSKIVAGDSKVGTPGLKSLTVDSLGTLGDAALAEADDVTSIITGRLGKLDVKEDIVAALLKIQGGGGAGLVEGHVGGDVIGGSFALSGAITTEGTIKALAIDGDLVGGSAVNAGWILPGSKSSNSPWAGIFLAVRRGIPGESSRGRSERFRSGETFTLARVPTRLRSKRGGASSRSMSKVT